ncbi:MAG: AAA family ATPase [Lachnospiraceae bacterium]|nr:AAA family ATPase [Lachnospiraceae bacterium]
MNVTEEVAGIIESTFSIAEEQQMEYVTPELMLLYMCETEHFRRAFSECGGSVPLLSSYLEDYLDRNVEDHEPGQKPVLSEGMGTVFAIASRTALHAGKPAVEITHLIHGIFALKESYAVFYLKKQGVEETELLQALTDVYPDKDDYGYGGNGGHGDGVDPAMAMTGFPDAEVSEGKSGILASFAPCLNDSLLNVNPLIGREAELERTIQILCRKDKNNPLHIGEPGVGKTAITYGLARRINEGKVPDALKGARIFALDLAGILAGTQYRGDFEKRMKRILDEVSKEEKPIIYIDEIHNLLGAGAVGEGAFDAANILKPYISGRRIRFIGATTYEEYKKHFEKSKSLVRRFQNVEIAEPSEEEAVAILQGLKKNYEAFHGVVYGKGVLEYAVSVSVKYINERFLPDKAIDLIDEAGAFLRIHPTDSKKQTVGKDLIDEVLTKICRIPKQTVEADDSNALGTLEARMTAQIFGQDPAIEQVVNAVKFSKAGLLEEDKPLSSLLFVGPTGVGKTEIAKTLARELGVKLIRFDMSEYGEKHAVAKLIGSPAGYVGYEEGGLLTEAIRKSPSAVLLLDEIEKAHPDIYNTLLQVMDYATLTDNQGRKADFRNVIIIMTSNVGAGRLGKKGMGFQAADYSTEVLTEEVKNTFQPEFRNRLNRIVIFRPMDGKMAEQIARKKLRELGKLLNARNIDFSATDEAVALLKEKGISREYGAREIDRMIAQTIKPLLVDEILFGKLKKGGRCVIDAKKGEFTARFYKSARPAEKRQASGDAKPEKSAAKRQTSGNAKPEKSAAKRQTSRRNGK